MTIKSRHSRLRQEGAVFGFAPMPSPSLRRDRPSKGNLERFSRILGRLGVEVMSWERYKQWDKRDEG